jgi:prepilin-type N-terminal cleavage/methylation domain-containing protein
MTRGICRGFTIIELLVVVGIISVLMAILLPSLGVARESAKRSRCGSQLASIGKAAQLYAAEWSEIFPCQPAPYYMLGNWTFPTYANAVDGLESEQIRELYANAGDDVTPFYLQMGDPAGNMWLLVLTHYVAPASFVCPSDTSDVKVADSTYIPPGGGVGWYGNFGAVGSNMSANTYSYAFTYPWASSTGKQVSWWKSSTGGDVPLAADMGPSGDAGAFNPAAKNDPRGPAGSPVSNSKIHNGAGQNVLYFDAHVVFSKDNRAGRNGDNIYTADSDNNYVTTGGAAFATTTNLDRMQSSAEDIIMAPARP